MCGICGEVRFDRKPADVSLVGRMKDKLRHRGPDDEGLRHDDFEDGGIALGHTRLAIIDLSSAGHQPMCDPTGRYWIVYNGEVYNYKEIRETFDKGDFIFETKTDTEVVLASYIKHGTKCLNLFNGMFSFAIWDNENKTLFCARDRLGIKPFYYIWENNVFYFASEIKALLVASEVKPLPDRAAVYDYMSLGLMHHKERSFFKSIRQIPAGCYMAVNPSRLSIEPYWSLSQDSLVTEHDFDIQTLTFLLEDSVRLRLRSDVPVGILLSGGLDSSTITTLAAHQGNGYLQAFSLQFNDTAFDESHHARLVASQCGASLRLLRPKGQGLWEELDDLIHAQDAPTHAPEVYSNWCMMRAVAQCDVKVLLSGQGGDELFGGYNWYPKHFLASLLRHGKLFTLFKELAQLPKNFPNDNTRSPFLLLALMLQALLPLLIKRRIKPELRCLDLILRPRFRKAMQSRDKENMSIFDPAGLEEKMLNDLIVCNVPHYLHYEDANSMAFGIEERVPLLDYRLIEFANKLGVWWKIRGGVSKYLLRRAMGDLLPAQVSNRRDKMGLSAPRDQWFRNELNDPIWQLFSSECRIYEEWIDRKSFLAQLDAYMSGRSTPVSRLLWRCINLEKWLRSYT